MFTVGDSIYSYWWDLRHHSLSLSETLLFVFVLIYVIMNAVAFFGILFRRWRGVQTLYLCHCALLLYLLLSLFIEDKGMQLFWFILVSVEFLLNFLYFRNARPLYNPWEESKGPELP